MRSPRASNRSVRRKYMRIASSRATKFRQAQQLYGLAAVFHQLLLSFYELLRAVDAPLVEHEVAHRGFDEHREVAAGGDGNCHLTDGHRKDFLEGRADLQPVEIGELLVAVVLQVHHELQELARPNRGLAENGADVEHTYAPHLEEVLEHRRATALDGVGRDAIELDDVVGYEPVAPRDELQRELALADGGGAGDEHAHFQDVEKDAVQRRRLCQDARQIEAQHVHHVR